MARRLAGAELAEHRVALFLNALPAGGAERNLLALARGLGARGYPVEWVLAERRGALLDEWPPALPCRELAKASWIASADALARLPVSTRHRLAALRWAARNPLARAVPGLAAYLRHTRPSVLVTTLPKNALVALWARELVGFPRRLVVREANAFSLEAGKAGARKAALLTDLARAWYPRADHIVAVSRGVATDLCSALGLAADRVTAIHNAVDAEAIARQAAEPLDDPWFRAGAPPVLLSVGRLSLQKDHATLLRAFAALRRERSARLVVLGEGPRRAALEELARELGVEHDVRLPGWVANPHRFTARAAVFVLSSAWEGFPNVLVEALACGCPVVSTDCPHGPAEILDGGVFGGLCPSGDAPALARALATALEAPPEPARLRTRARDFSPERTLRAYCEVMFPGVERAGPAAGGEPSP